MSILLTACLLVGLLPTVALAAEGDVEYLYYDENSANWQTGTIADSEYTVVTEGNDMWGETGQTTWYVVQGDVEFGTGETYQCVNTRGDVRLILADGCTLTLADGLLALGNLTVYAQSTGDNQGRMSVNANSADFDSTGIAVSGNFTINGGSVTATGGEGLYDSHGIYAKKTLTITGGTIKAEGSDITTDNESSSSRSYGIEADMMIVNGGSVEAEGGDLTTSMQIEAASGSSGIRGSVTINGGSVTATAGSITGNWNIATSSGIGGNVTINGGHLIAQVLGAETTDASRSALASMPTTLPSAYWWRIAANEDFTASDTGAYEHDPTNTYVEITDFFTVTLDPNYEGSTPSTAITGTDGKLTTEALPDLTRSGYTFAGWFTAAESGEKVTTNTVFDQNATIYAHWTIKTYTITLNANGGTVETSTLTTGDGWKLTGNLPTPTRDGYTFVSWFTAAEGGTEVTENTVFAKDTTIYAHWTINQYTITFDTDGGSEIAPITQDYGTAVTAPENPTKTGYTFAGWDTEIPDTMPAEDMTITAKWTKNSSGGGVSTYAINVESAENGTVTMTPKTAAKGVTVTLTVEPDKGYTLETLTVTDKNGNEIELTNKGDGKYTFTMPASKVTVKATFMEDNSMLNFFVDVPADAYYYDAVLWAVENGVTEGTNADGTLFSPNDPCTRAQVVTFLWRAAGSPEPESLRSLSDVPADAYYAKAVAWALENGITTGTGDGLFSPDAVCSRAQIVTFLWRAQQSPAAGSANPFLDVAADAYYTDAVLWAVENGVTMGTNAEGTAFSPDDDCTRAQIVTFLFRCLGGE